MDLHTLRRLVAIADAGSLTRAAARLFVARPALAVIGVVRQAIAQVIGSGVWIAGHLGRNDYRFD